MAGKNAFPADHPQPAELVNMWRGGSDEDRAAFRTSIQTLLRLGQASATFRDGIAQALADGEIFDFVADIEAIATDLSAEYDPRGQQGDATNVSARLVAVPIMGMKAAARRLVRDARAMSKIAQAFRETGIVTGQSRVVLYPHLVDLTDLARVGMEDLFVVTSSGMREGLKGDLVGSQALPALEKMTSAQKCPPDPENTLVNDVILGVEVSFTPDRTRSNPGVLDLLRQNGDENDGRPEDCLVQEADARWHQLLAPYLERNLKVMTPVPWQGLRASLLLSNVSTCLGMALRQQGRTAKHEDCEVSLSAEGMHFLLRFSHEGQFITDVRFHHALVGNELSEFMALLDGIYRYQMREAASNFGHH